MRRKHKTKKSKGKKLKQKGKKKTKSLTKVDSPSSYVFRGIKDCHQPKFVKVGDREVFLCGDRDIDSKSEKIIATLDIFFGLSRGWDDYSQIYYSNKFCRMFQKLVEDNLPTNVFLHPIRDQGTDEGFAEAVLWAFNQGWNIGFGCMAGHGRTGWLLGYLIRETEGLEGKELLETVRERWCKEAIEGKEQYESLGIPWTPEVTKVFQVGSYSSLLPEHYIGTSPLPETAKQSYFEQWKKEQAEKVAEIRKRVEDEEKSKKEKELVEDVIDYTGWMGY